MKTGKYGLSLLMVSILAFVLGFFGFTEILVLVLGFGVIAEKDMWLTKQTLQALYLRLSYSIITVVLGWVFTAFSWLLGTFNAYKAVTAITDIQVVINGALYIGLFVLSLLAVLNLLKGKDASVPLISKLADFTLNNVPIKTKSNQTSNDVAQAQGQNQPVQQSIEPSAQEVQQPQQPPIPPVETTEAQPAENSEEVKDDGSWICSCGKENDGNFCVMCGKPKNN